MHAEFNDVQRAASYLSEGLSQDFPDAVVELILCDAARNRFRCAVCPCKSLAAELLRMCRQFQGAAVDYTPDRPYGMVGVLSSTEHRFNTSVSDSRRHRPIVTSRSDGRYVKVFLREINHQEVLLGSRSVVPHAATEVIDGALPLAELTPAE